jgi:hypothetical protein
MRYTVAIFNSNQYETKFSCIAGVGLDGVYSSSQHILLYSGFDHYPILSTNQVNDIIILYINSSNKGMLILSNSGNRLQSTVYCL